MSDEDQPHSQDEKRQPSSNDSPLDSVAENAEKAGIDLKKVVSRPISPQDIQYLKDRFPFMQLLNASEHRQIAEKPEFITAQSGWILYDYGDALCASPGTFLWGGGNHRIHIPGQKKEKDEEQGGAGTGELNINQGHGTLIKQAVDTGAEMIYIAMERGWPAADIVDGHHWMMWGAWMLAEDREYLLGGYEPSLEDKARRQRLRRSKAEIEKLFMALKNR